MVLNYASNHTELKFKMGIDSTIISYSKQKFKLPRGLWSSLFCTHTHIPCSCISSHLAAVMACYACLYVICILYKVCNILCGFVMFYWIYLPHISSGWDWMPYCWSEAAWFYSCMHMKIHYKLNWNLKFQFWRGIAVLFLLLLSVWL